MIISIKPHSTLQKFFRGTDLKAEVNSYADILDYLQSIHPDFIVYIKKQAEIELQETFVFLDKNLRELTKDEMFIRRAKEGDIIYIVPAIVGGGGKRGIFAMLAMAALLIAMPYLLPTLAGTTLIGATATTAAVTIGTLATTVGINLALMGVSMLLMPKAGSGAAESSRDNDAFGSLVNTTTSGMPIALNYGLVRVAGQLVSGYVKTMESDKDDIITLKDVTSV